jgi:hypothetical protein
MHLHRQDIIDLADTITKAVRECRDILIKAAERQRETPQASSAAATEAHPERLPELLTRAAAVAYLRDVAGYPISKSFLAKAAVYGDGPPFQSFGRRVVYAPADLRAWAERRSRRRTSTSDPGLPARSKA